MKSGICSMIAAALIAVSICGCSSSQKETSNTDNSAEKQEILNLDGVWVLEDENDPVFVQEAIISGKTIQIYWGGEDSDLQALYWEGSFAPPDKESASYSWVSDRDKEKTDSAILASSDDTKKFNYSDGVLSYQVSAMGVDKTVRLKRSDKEIPVDTSFNNGQIAETETENNSKDETKEETSSEKEQPVLINSGYTVRESDYDDDLKFVVYAVEVENPNSSYAIERPELSIVLRNKDNQIIKTDDVYLPVLPAEDTIFFADTLMYEGEVPETVEISLKKCKDYSFTTAKYPKSSELVVLNVSKIDHDSSTSFTGEFSNNSGKEISGAQIILILKKDGKMVGGKESITFDEIADGDTVPFEIEDYDFPSYNDFDIYVYAMG